MAQDQEERATGEVVTELTEHKSSLISKVRLPDSWKVRMKREIRRSNKKEDKHWRWGKEQWSRSGKHEEEVEDKWKWWTSTKEKKIRGDGAMATSEDRSGESRKLVKVGREERANGDTINATCWNIASNASNSTAIQHADEAVWAIYQANATAAATEKRTSAIIWFN